MITAFGVKLSPVEEAEASAQEWLDKPVTASTLMDAISRVLAPKYAEVRRTIPEGERRRLSLEGMTILVVEDNEMNQQIVAELLENEGAIVEIAANGREAVDKLHRSLRGTRYALVFMDVQMPQMDGHEATRLIRQDGRFADLPIIALTAHAMAEERHRCIEAGMDDHISKPINPRELIETAALYGKRSTGDPPTTVEPVQ